MPKPALEPFGPDRDRLRLQGIKLLVDGAPQGKTAFWGAELLTPGPNGEANWRSQPVCPPEQLMEVEAVA